ncbi:Uncharacterised protein [Mycobacterium tuberculosis]|nr:Uncharacterised protein [Mycobacterium tuberculosis]
MDRHPVNQLPLAANWFGLASLVVINVGIWAQSRRNGNKVTDIRTQVTNGGTNLAMTVGEIKAQLVELRTHFTRSVDEMRAEVSDLKRRLPPAP